MARVHFLALPLTRTHSVGLSVPQHPYLPNGAETVPPRPVAAAMASGDPRWSPMQSESGRRGGRERDPGGGDRRMGQTWGTDTWGTGGLSG